MKCIYLLWTRLVKLNALVFAIALLRCENRQAMTVAVVATSRPPARPLVKRLASLVVTKAGVLGAFSCSLTRYLSEE